jgi:choline dehydrogenase-like flavoprotein
LERHLNHEGVIHIVGDDEPEEVNRVELDWTELDRFGLPGVRTHYRLSENSMRLGAQAIRRATELSEASGATSVRHFPLSPVIGWHLLGTARMGTDPTTSVVDGDHRSHDIPNLFLADGSSMATGGGVNPAHTIQALGLRAADRIYASRREL